MFRIVLQRSAFQNRIAEQLEAVSLDELLRRMQSSSLTNPARSLEAHFVLATERPDHESTTPAAAAPSADKLKETAGVLLRNALSERLLAEVRRDLDSPIMTFDDCSLMLANCIRHGLSPFATQQIFRLWQQCMHRAETGACSAALSRSSISLLDRVKGSSAFACPSRGTAGVSELTQFQSLVRVMEACLDAHDGQKRDLSLSMKDTSRGALGLRRIQPQGSIHLTLDDLAALVGCVEQHLALFTDHGTSTTGLLVQFSALVLMLAGCASSVAAEADPGSTFLNSLRLLSRLQTDRGLLRQRIYSICGQAIGSLCAQEVDSAAAGDGRVSPRERSWWYQPQELVRLSRAIWLIRDYEAERQGNSGSVGGTRVSAEHSSHGDVGKPRRPESSFARHSSKDSGRVGLRLASAVRSTPPRRPQTASESSTSWPRRFPTAWWSSSSTFIQEIAAPHRRTETTLQTGLQLGSYVMRYAMQNVPRARPRRSALPPLLPSYAVSPALLSLSLLDLEEIFATVCTTAFSLSSTETAKDFSWWVRDYVLQQRRHSGMDSVLELAGLLGIAEVCVVYPDGTQTVLAEALKCLERSTAMLWCVGDSSLPSELDSPGLLWPRACQLVSDALPLTTVRAEAQRTLQALVLAASQTSSFISLDKSGGERARRHKRYTLLELACLQLQTPGCTITPALSQMLQELVLAAPFRRDDTDHGGLAAVARALFIFTRPKLTSSVPESTPTPTQGTLLNETVIPYLLNELSRLLSSSAASDGDTTVSVVDGRDRLLPLQQLTSAERQLLRSALQAVRLYAHYGGGEIPPWELLLAPNSSGVDERHGMPVAPVPVPSTLSVIPQVGVAASAPPFGRPAGAMDEKFGASHGRGRSHEQDRQRRTRASEEHLLLQTEIDTLTRSLG